MAKIRLDHLLTQRGLAESGSQAKRLIMAGLVYVKGQKVDKAGTSFAEDVVIDVRETLPFVSRGGLKIQKALDIYPLPTEGIIALDVGASTGGFTDCLLQRGAKKVYAVDVGHSQLHYRLCKDERVINLERTHIRKLTAEQVEANITALVIDTSFISLHKVLPLAWPFLAIGGWAVALIKPQFEVGSENLAKGGVVRDPVIRQQAVDDAESMAGELPHAHVLGVSESPITGPKGNVEYLLVIQKNA
ncbi:MAG: TlyA family RNA methyltransferase [Mariprofundaceae bacterium]|nr:TlyA family RNA methyltransferase [Mariprofundaceae bacterium]